MYIKVSEEFTDTPGVGLKSSGKYSGEEFFETLLGPRFIESLERGEKLTVDLDGGYGYAISFLREAFGRLARKFTKDVVKYHLIIISQDNISLIDNINKIIDEIESKKYDDEYYMNEYNKSSHIDVEKISKRKFRLQKYTKPKYGKEIIIMDLMSNPDNKSEAYKKSLFECYAKMEKYKPGFFVHFINEDYVYKNYVEMMEKGVSPLIMAECCNTGCGYHIGPPKKLKPYRIIKRFGYVNIENPDKVEFCILVEDLMFPMIYLTGEESIELIE